MSEDLNSLLDFAVRNLPTPHDIWQQRVSFVFGQMMDCNPAITREQVGARAVEIYGPCPPKVQ